MSGTSYGDIRTEYDVPNGPGSAVGDFVVDYHRTNANFPASWLDSGLDYVIPTAVIEGKTGSWIRYFGHNTSEEVTDESDLQFDPDARGSKQVSAGTSLWKIDFSVTEAEINNFQTFDTSFDIQRRIRQAMQINYMKTFYRGVGASSFTASSTPQEDRYLGTLPATTWWDPETEQPATATSNQPWNLEKVITANEAFATNKFGSDDMSMPYICVSAKDSVSGLLRDKRTQHLDYKGFADMIMRKGKDFYMGGQGDISFGGWEWVTIPQLHPDRNGQYQGPPCTGTGQNAVYDDFVFHPRGLHFVKPGSAPSMVMEVYWDKNSAQMRFRNRQRCGLCVMNPTAIIRVKNKGNNNVLTQPS